MEEIGICLLWKFVSWVEGVDGSVCSLIRMLKKIKKIKDILMMNGKKLNLKLIQQLYQCLVAYHHPPTHQLLSFNLGPCGLSIWYTRCALRNFLSMFFISTTFSLLWVLNRLSMQNCQLVFNYITGLVGRTHPARIAAAPWAQGEALAPTGQEVSRDGPQQIAWMWPAGPG